MAPRPIQALERMLAADPRSPVFVEVASALADAGRHARAAQVLRDGLVHHPGDVQARIALARSLFELGDREAALREIGLVGARHRDDPFVAQLASELLEKLLPSEAGLGTRTVAAPAPSARAAAAADRRALIPINGAPLDDPAPGVVSGLVPRREPGAGADPFAACGAIELADDHAAESASQDRTTEGRITAEYHRKLRQHLAARRPQAAHRLARRRVVLAIGAVLLVAGAAVTYLAVRQARSSEEARAPDAVRGESGRRVAKPAAKGARGASGTSTSPARRDTRADKRSGR